MGRIAEAALKDPDIAIGSDVYADDFTPFVSIGPGHVFGKRWPIRHGAIRIWQRGRRLSGLRFLLRVFLHGKRGDNDSTGHKPKPHTTRKRHVGPPSVARTKMLSKFRPTAT